MVHTPLCDSNREYAKLSGLNIPYVWTQYAFSFQAIPVKFSPGKESQSEDLQFQ